MRKAELVVDRELVERYPGRSRLLLIRVIEEEVFNGLFPLMESEFFNQKHTSSEAAAALGDYFLASITINQSYTTRLYDHLDAAVEGQERLLLEIGEEEFKKQGCLSFTEK